MDQLSALFGHLGIRKGPPGKPQTLERLDLPSVAKFIKSDKCQNIMLMTGAGISTSAGIPDFRSPDTGLYANLARLKLPYPEAVFDINYFKQNPKPFYTLASELYPGYYRPTVTHSFIRLLSEKGKLHTCFTQNIDTLERVAGVPLEKIIEAHGSFATQRCIRCHALYPDDQMKEHVLKASVPTCKKCSGLVKPDIVFFGEGLPDEFSDAAPYLQYADLLIIIGTSLTVYPFAGLRNRVPDDCPRVLINIDRVSDIGSRSDDVVLLMECDEAVRKICDEIGDGWREELERLWKETESSYTPRGEVEEQLKARAAEEEKRAKEEKASKHAHLEAEVARMAKKVEEKMHEPGSEVTQEAVEGTAKEVVAQPTSKGAEEAKAADPATVKESTPHYENAKSQPVLPSEPAGDKTPHVSTSAVESDPAAQEATKEAPADP